MASTCSFCLDKSSGIYHSGEPVEGSVIINLPSQNFVDGIHIALCGEGSVFWKKQKKTEKTGNRNSMEIVEFTSHENYNGPRQRLMDAGYMQPGQYILRFSLHLPVDCPSSFEGSLGVICYYLLVVICTNTCLSIDFTHPINVIRTDDLNLNPSNKLPLAAELIKRYSHCACIEDRILLSFIAPFRACIPRQKLSYALSIENNSKKDVYAYAMTIIQKISYISRMPYKRERLECNEVYNRKYLEKCSRGMSREIQGDFEIPDVTPTSEGRNKIINIEYELLVYVYIGGSNKTLNMSLPLYIGTVPLRESITDDSVINAIATAPILPPPLEGEIESQKYQDFCWQPFDEMSGITYPRTCNGVIVCAPSNRQ